MGWDRKEVTKTMAMMAEKRRMRTTWRRRDRGAAGIVWIDVEDVIVADVVESSSNRTGSDRVDTLI